MKKFIILTIAIISTTFFSYSQTGTDFWLAPPEITYDHNSPGGEPIYLMISCMDQDAVVTIEQPANPGFNGGTPITINITANSSHREDLTPYINDLETKPTDAVLNTGLHVSSTEDISVYYEIANTNNTDIYALKGANGLGTEFYIPMNNYSGFYNHTFATNPAYASFDIVATEDNTTIMIYTRHDVDGHNALEPFTITLDRGQTYSCGWTGANYTDPSTHPTGAVVLSDKPVGVSWKDDSCHNPSGGCYDLMGDQIVPVEIVGKEYIAVKGQLNEPNGDESVFVTAIQNNTKIYTDGSTTELTTLFAGQTYRIDVDNPTLYVEASKPVYLTHVTGFGCEEGVALLPPLNCAGSEQVSFVRSSTEEFFLTLLVKNGHQSDFVITGPGTATIDPTAFNAVAGTNNEWVSAIIQFDGTEIPDNQAHLITNTSDVFSMGIINGGSSSGCRYGYFSEFVAEITVDAGANQIVCANDTVHLNGAIGGGATTGIWTTNGTGSFDPDPSSLSVDYIPSLTDVTGSIKFWLTSTGMCSPQTDSITVTFTPAPDVFAGDDQTIGENNPDVQLAGTITVATGGQWSNGNGSFSPDELDLNAIYTPTAAELSAGSFTLILTSTGNGICYAETDEILVNVDPAPGVSAGADQTLCANNPDATLSGTITNASGGIWSGGSGIYNPNNTALNIIYTPTAAEITSGSVTLTLTTTGNGANNPESSDVTIFFTNTPTANTGTDQTACSNTADISLNGSVTVATGGQWIGGFGTFNPNRNTLNAVYTPTAAEIASGGISLTLETTGNGTCLAVQDNINIGFNLAPSVNAGADQSVCSNNATTSLTGTITDGASMGIWSGGAGTFSPSNTDLNATYTPTAAEISTGSVSLTLTSTDNGNCLAENDVTDISFTAAPVVSAGSDKTVCGNNSDVVLNGSVTIASGGQWTGGNGIFNPSQNALNAIYSPTAAEIASGTVNLVLTSTGNGNCNAESSSLSINITPIPTADAGDNQTVCANNPEVSLDGSVTIATGGQWSGGLGNFNPSPNDLNAVYTPTATEIANGTVSLTLTTIGNGDCNPVSDQMTVTITPAPTIDAGPNQTVCANNADVTLAASYTLASGIQWSGGLGSFNPLSTDPLAVYTPTAAEIASGAMKLYATTTGNGTCLAVIDSMNITFTNAPTANAGTDVSVCGNNAELNLNGQVTVASGGIWSGGTGTFSPNNTNLSASYTPSATEIANGVANLTLTTTGNGTCNAVSNDIVITITAPPTVNAGTDQTLCANNATATLNGSVSVATGGQWSGGSGTFSPNSTSLAADYTPSASEITNGSVTLTLTSTGNGGCLAVSEDVILNFSSAPIVDAGLDVTVGGNNSTASLSGSVTVASGGVWSGGTGTYDPNASSLSINYTPSPSEVSAGNTMLYLTSTGNGTCNAVIDSVNVIIEPAPIVEAGNDITACENNPNFYLNGSISNAGGGIWTGGTGSFIPGNTDLNAEYIPTPAEISSGQLKLYLTSTGNGSNTAVTDSLSITFNSAPSAYAGNDQNVCSNNADIVLTGSVTLASGGTWSGGLGVFNPSANNLTTQYSPTQTEINTGSVKLILTTTGNGSCLAVSDTMQVIFDSSPTVEAGPNQTLCANNSVASLNGSVTIATGGIWSGGLGSFSPSNSSLNASYTPHPLEITNGSVTLKLTSTGNGDCNPVTDSLTLFFTPAPTINAGADISACENNNTVTLSGSVNGASGIIWSGGTGTYNPDNTSQITTYTPSSTELANGSATLTITSTGNGTCNAVNDQMTITFTPSPNVQAGSDQIVCGNNASTTLSGTISGAVGGQWSGGSGIFSPSSTDLNASYTPSASEISNGTITLTLTSTGNGNCIAETDQIAITITETPTVEAGPNQIVCANNSNVALGASYTVASGGYWHGGTGTYNPVNTDPNAIYSPSASELAAGSAKLYFTTSGNGTCLAVTDSVFLTITPPPIVDAGEDLSACMNNPTVVLSGNVTNATGGQWTGGAGVFNPNNTTLNASYTPTSGELASGSVILTLTSIGNGNCNAVSDNIIITYNSAPSVNAGSDQVICSNNADIQLNGIVAQASGGSWTGGLGIFTPDNNTLNTIYTPTAGEIAAGSLSLILTSTGNGNCLAVADTMDISFTEAPTAFAGSDLFSCANNSSVALNASVTVATGGVWSGGLGTYSPDPTSLTTSYIPSALEIANGVANLVLTTTGNGNCSPVTDNISVTITPAPIVDAGDNQSLCANNATITLNGNITGASGGIWSGGSGIFNPGNTSLNTTYTPTPTEIANGSITLTLSSTGNGDCLSVSDDVTITFTNAPTASAGNDITLCSNNADVDLSGVITLATGAIWSGGTGTYSPDNTSLNTTYTPSAQELTQGWANLTLTTTGNGNCSAVSDNILVSFTSAPSVDAGTDQSVCANNAELSLTGNVSVASGGTWSSSGSGSFAPSNTSLITHYIPSATDISNGQVVLTLSSTGNGNCIAENDQMTAIFTASPQVNAGSDQTVCPDNLNIQLNGSISGGTNTGIWNTTGSGSFIPSAIALNATYVASSADSSNQGALLYLTSTNNGTCLPVYDSMQVNIFPAGTADAGSNITLCSNNGTVSLNGNVGGGASGGQWLTSGSGTFSPNNTNLNANYIPSAYDTSNGSVTLTLQANSCNTAEDQITVTYTTAPYINAGDDIFVCLNNPDAQLNGQVTIASGGIWSGGNGNFTSGNTDLNAIYTPSASEISSGYAQLILTSTGNGDCIEVKDTVDIYITPPPTVNAGPNLSVCANNAEINLNGSVSGGSTTGQWSTSGTGSFSPDASSLNAIYIPSNGDITDGSVTLTLTSTNNNGCSPVDDNLLVSFTPAPTANAGADVTACSNNVLVPLNGAITVVSGGIWSSSGSGSFVPGNTSLSATYIPSLQDTALGEVTLTLTTTGNGNCVAESDEMVITMTDAPNVNAGNDIITCVDDLEVSLYGSVSGATTTGIWTTTGNGTFLPNNTSLITNYQASSLDSIQGNVTFYLTSTNNGNCIEVTDTLQLNISPAGVANAGIDQTVCANNPQVALNGFITGGASEGIWTTSGSGTFIPNNTTLNASYQPSAVDTSLGSVTLTLAATNSCNSAEDNMQVSFSPAPAAHAGSDITVCGNNANVNLSGSVEIASGGSWSSSGTGTFVPNNTSLSPAYIPSNADLDNGSVIITLSTTGNGNCISESDNLQLNISPAPQVFPGPDQTVCEGSTMTQLMGLISGSTITGEWTTSGTGTFIPGNTVLNAYYEFSAADSAAGFVDLTLTSTNNGNCNAVSDNLNITFGDAPFVYAGTDQTICGNSLQANLNGIVSGGSSTGQWSTQGSGYFYPSNTSLSPTYYFSTADSISGHVQLILQSTNNGTCQAGKDTVLIFVEPVPQIEAGLNQTVCETDSVVLNASLIHVTGMHWSTSGSGFFSSNSSTNSVYYPSLSDVIYGEIYIYAQSTGSASCNAVTDSLKISFQPVGLVEAGPDQSVCKNNPVVSLNGQISDGASQGIWTSTGSGIFSPNATVLDASYTPSPTDTTQDNIVLTLTATNSCNYVADSMVITFTEPPTVNAGLDVTVCANNSDVNLNGNISIASGGIWSSSGDGVFIPSTTSLNTVYTPGNNDIDNGSAYLYLTSLGNGNCNAVTDVVHITITDAPIANAGPDQQVCSTSTMTQLIGSVSGNTSTGAWSTLGSGTFAPNNTNLGAYYQFSSADVTSGNVEIVLTTTNNGLCYAVTDTVNINFGSTVYAYAGEDLQVCADDMQADLNGTVSGGSTTGIWSTSGTGEFIPNNETIDATYQFSNIDSLLGSVELVLTSTNNGGCIAGTDTAILSIEQVPLLDAGSNRVVCANETDIQITADYQNASGLEWSTSGDGYFEPNNHATTITYVFGIQDLNNGDVFLYVETEGNDACGAVIDTVKVSMIPEGYVNAGNDIEICSNNTEIQLSGNLLGGASQGIWTSTGNGSFIPDANTLNAKYIPSSQDTSNGELTLILTATNSCNLALDSLIISFTPAPTIFAGNDQTVCANNNTLTLEGEVTIASGALWSTSGDGQFSPGGASLNTYFTPGSIDLENGETEIYLTSTGNGTCIPVVDTLNVTITPSPIVNAGPDQVVCSSSASTELIGSVSGGSSTGIWTITYGSGSIVSTTSPQTEYIFGTNDTINGYVNLVLSSTENGNCLAESDAITITFGDTPFVYAGEDQTICANNNALLEATISGGSTTGQWSSSGTGVFTPDNEDLNANYIPSSADSIYGVVELVLFSTNNGDCQMGTDTVIISIDPIPVVSSGGPYYACSINDSVYLEGNIENAAEAFWSTNGSGHFVPDEYELDAIYMPGANDSLLSNIDIWLTSLATDACAPVSDSTTIEKITPLIPDFSYSATCIGDIITFTDQSEVIEGNIISWEWDFGNGNTSNAPTAGFTYNSTGNYDVSLTVESSLGCSFEVTKNIEVVPYPVASFSYNSVCYLDSVSFMDESTITTGSINSWTWVYGDGDTSYVQNPNHLYNINGNYNVLLSVTSNAGCSSAISQTISVYNGPESDFEFEYDCSDHSVSFTDASSSTNLAITEWNWTFGDGSTSTDQNPIHVYDSIGDYSVMLISGNSENCADTSTAII